MALDGNCQLVLGRFPIVCQLLHLLLVIGDVLVHCSSHRLELCFASREVLLQLRALLAACLELRSRLFELRFKGGTLGFPAGRLSGGAL